jgi:leader peptidase (prepilin peptidase)/N-methyltransferase
VSWALVQLALAGIAAYDLITRRIRNFVTAPGALLAILLRAIFEPSKLVEVLIAGAIVFLAFLALALVLQGGFGMGDAKLAGMLGFVLGSAVVPALLIGTAAGGILGAAVLARSRSKRKTIAYGPYLALGAAIAIVAFDPPPLV